MTDTLDLIGSKHVRASRRAQREQHSASYESTSGMGSDGQTDIEPSGFANATMPYLSEAEFNAALEAFPWPQDPANSMPVTPMGLLSARSGFSRGALWSPGASSPEFLFEEPFMQKACETLELDPKLAGQMYERSTELAVPCKD